MRPSTIVEITEVAGNPKVKLDLPVPMRVGDRIGLRFRLKRLNGGRTEVLDVAGEFRVASVGLTLDHQSLRVETVVGKVPVWRAIRKEPAYERTIPPARFPPTVL